jgi:peptide deformylase
MIVTDENILRQVSTEVLPQEVEDLYRQLSAEVNLHSTAVGLSAIQIGIPKRAFLALMSSVQPGHEPEWILWINPQIDTSEESEGFIELEEGCLSFPRRVVRTKRHRQILVSAQNSGYGEVNWSERHQTVLTEFDAAIFQHELDHLNGKLMFDRGVEIKIGVPRHIEKIGRNDLCSCGSGKKHKKCCGR